jgi:hypothetical protein
VLCKVQSRGAFRTMLRNSVGLRRLAKNVRAAEKSPGGEEKLAHVIHGLTKKARDWHKGQRTARGKTCASASNSLPCLEWAMLEKVQDAQRRKR